MHLSRQVLKLTLVSDVLYSDGIFSVKRYVSAETPLMKQILSYKNKADIPMMTTLREQVTHVFRIHLVQQVVENYETRFTVIIAKILVYTLVKTVFM